jgi:hypothetical protein
MLDGKVTRYEMFCSMGNGFCFPLETLLFASICEAAYKHAGMKPDYRCYGDDIVVKRSIALVVIECLRAFGFRVNIDKTYVHGPFRESCGANSYGGQEVTPGYYKDPVSTLSELYARHNSLAKWPEVQAVMRTFAPKGHVVPDLPRFRWVTDQAFRVPLDVAMCSKDVYWDRHLQGWFTTVLSTIPKAHKQWLREFKGSNPEQMVLTAGLRGAQCAEEPFYLRHATKHVEKRLGRAEGLTPKCVTPFVSDALELYDSHVKLWIIKTSRRRHAHLHRPLMAAIAHYKTAFATVLT